MTPVAVSSARVMNTLSNNSLRHRTHVSDARMFSLYHELSLDHVLISARVILAVSLVCTPLAEIVALRLQNLSIGRVGTL
jgi:hypothetical protein